MRATGRTAAAFLAAFLAALGLAFGAPASAESVLRVSMHSDLKIIDPIWTTALISADHGYLVYDTLFALDEALTIKPQMVDKWEVSPDKLTWTFTLRDGLEWHDGTKVTAADCVASIRRWGARNSMGQMLMSFTGDLAAPDDRTIRLVLKEPYGLVLEALGKTGANVPFMMPRRVAETAPNSQINDATGSGPFIFKRDEWKAGEKAVYIRNPKYKPRAEPPSGLSGGKVAKVDRVEWIWIADSQTQVNAILKGEIDLIQITPYDLLPLIDKSKDVATQVVDRPGRQFIMRFNTLAKPFDDARIRQAVTYALTQKPFLEANIGDPRYYKECKSLFPCGLPLESTVGWEDRLSGDVAKARKLLEEAGYDGTPLVLLHQTDVVGHNNLATVATAAARAGGLQGRPSGDGLADAGDAPHQEGPAAGRRLARLLHLLGRAQHPRPGGAFLPQRRVREGAIRLALRCRDRAPARPVCTRRRCGEPAGHRHRRAAAGRRVSHPCAARPVHDSDGGAQERQRPPDRTGRRVLERGKEIRR